MEQNKYCVIMAGGIGSRFWPKSRQAMPKQFLDILGTGKSFIRHTFERFEKLIPAEHFLVVTNRRYKALVLEHLPELKPEQVLCEPIGRNTAPCIAYAAYTLLKKDPNAEMVVTPSDHFILNEEDFRAIISEGLSFADKEQALVTIGIKPTRPDTGYGYIQVSDNQPLSKVKCFTEKPNLELAQTFLQCGEFFWNSGIFIWTVKAIVEAFERYLPEHHALFTGLMPALGTEEESEAVERVFAECRAISIDYGVMERAENVYVRCGEFGWSDVGTWGSVYQHSRKDRYANATPQEGCFLYDTRSSFVSLPKDKIAVISGLKEYIVVDTEDVLMICPRSEEQNIKKFIDEVKFRKGDQHI
ncbi:MAG: mannose-1-phosphate guanylyltransferase [Alistipes sp.]|nr:mannose-1-phosphate guanylyltransferase [Alistipes sp.]